MIDPKEILDKVLADSVCPEHGRKRLEVNGICLLWTGWKKINSTPDMEGQWVAAKLEEDGCIRKRAIISHAISFLEDTDEKREDRREAALFKSLAMVAVTPDSEWPLVERMDVAGFTNAETLITDPQFRRESMS